MTWNALTFAFESQLTTTKMSLLMENFASMAQGDSGAPNFSNSSITDATCAQGNLVTTTASGSTTGDSITYTLVGGTYSWWTAGAAALGFFGNGDVAAGSIGLLHGSSTTYYFDERYVQSSPPYDLGDGEVPLFIFLLMNRDGSIAGSQVAQDPPWANNGPTCLTPQRTEGRRKFRCYRRLGFGGPLMAELTEAQKLAYLRGELSLVEDWVELTTQWKNRDMEVIPHPFGRVGVNQTVVLLDPFRDEQLFSTFKLLQESVHAREVRQLFLDGDVVIDNERTQMRGAPRGVLPVRAKLR